MPEAPSTPETEPDLAEFRDQMEAAMELVTFISAIVPLENLEAFAGLENPAQAMDVLAEMTGFSEDRAEELLMQEYLDGDRQPLSLYRTNHEGVFVSKHIHPDGIVWAIRSEEVEEGI